MDISAFKSILDGDEFMFETANIPIGPKKMISKFVHQFVDELLFRWD